MRRAIHQVLALTTLVAACGGGGGGSGTVNYQPGTPDPTAPGVNLLITRSGQPNLEVQARKIPPGTPVSGNYGDPVPNSRSSFSVLATATDNESGIKHIRLTVTRTVCFRASNGGVAQAYSGTVTRKEATYTDSRNAPIQASLGDTGIIDPTTPPSSSVDNLLVWTDANGTRRLGIGVSTKWNMEATNFASQTVYSDVIFILAGDVSCVTSP